MQSPFGLKTPFNQAPFYPRGGVGIGGYIVDGVTPTLVLDMCVGFYGTRELEGLDYREDGVGAVLVLDVNNNFYGSEA